MPALIKCLKKEAMLMKPIRITGALGFWHSANYDKSSYHFLSKKKE
jgi:hypothetical protein